MNASASEREAVGSMLEREGKEREEINPVRYGYLLN